MRERLKAEWNALIEATRSLDKLTVFVLTATALSVILHEAWGSRRFFRTEFADLFPDETVGLMAWGWRFATQGIFGFILPVLCLMIFFKKRPSEIGLGLGDWKLASTLALLYIPLVIIGTWVLSADTAFLDKYPHYKPAAFDWGTFFIYEALFLFYWIGWEYLWRGFVLFGTAHTFGLYAIFVQTVPFALLHINKPLPEAILSIVGGIALGALVWRCRSFWIAVPIHAAQMMILDFWCTLRLRTEVSGIGWDALVSIFQKWLG